MDSDADKVGQAPSQSPSQFINANNPDDAKDADADKLGQAEQHQLTEERVTRLDDLVPELNSGPRSRKSSRKSSLSSLLTDISKMDMDDQTRTGIESAVESDVGEDESDSESSDDDPMTGANLEAESSDAGRNEHEAPVEPRISETSNDDNNVSADSALATQLAQVGLRRSTRNKQTPEALTPHPLPDVVRKPVVKKDTVVVLVGFSFLQK